ncbi:hypothetical protein BJX62DRAFT_216125 [Aspergillus germanicus]
MYYNAVDRCHRALAELVQGISGLSPTPTSLADLVTTYPTKNGQYALPDKIRLSIKREDLDRQIQEMETSILTLQRISDSIASLKAQAIEQPTSTHVGAFVSALNTVRNHAKRLYSAIAVAYPTTCHSQHEARLVLQSRSDLGRKRPGGGTKKDLTFIVSFSPTGSLPDPIPSYRGNITVMDDDGGTQASSTSITKKKVTISLPSVPNSPSKPKSAMANLCSSIRHAREGGLILDLYLAENRYLTYCNLHDTGTGLSTHTWHSHDEFVQLEHLLQGKLGKPWQAIPKIALSLTIASSFLQLVSTPWLRCPLTSKSVRFSRSAIETASHNQRSIPEPFVEERFATPTVSCQSCPCSVREYTLELGILLLEIQHWKTIDTYQAERLRNGQTDTGSRGELARIWADETKMDMLEFHWEAIQRCLCCMFASKGAVPDWDDSMLRKSIAELVIRPLQEHCPLGLR